MSRRYTLLQRAKAKVRHLSSRQYYGHLTPSEFLVLLKHGIVGSQRDIDSALFYKQRGDSEPRWFYFQLGSLTLDQ